VSNEIVISDLVKKFGDNSAVDHLSLHVNSGELYGLIGPDGAGKTTTLRLLCGLLVPDQGSCRIAGYDVKNDIRQVRSMIGYMPQRFSLYPDLTVAENLRFFADLFNVPKGEREKRLQRLAQFSRLDPFMNRRASQLSGGMKQKLALSCTLIHTPRVLLLDEPTTGVDPLSRQEFWQILKDLQSQGVTLLVTTPYMDEAAKCDHIALIHCGKMLVQKPSKDISSLFPRQMFEVYTQDPVRSAHFMRKHQEFASVQIFGDRLHVSSDISIEPFESAAREVLSQEGIPVHSIKKITPSIEDVFVELLR